MRSKGHDKPHSSPRSAVGAGGFLLLALVAGCELTEPSPGGMFVPARVQQGAVAQAAPSTPPAAPSTPQGGYDFDGEDRSERPAGGAADVEDLYGAFGLERPDDAPPKVDLSAPIPQEPPVEPPTTAVPVAGLYDAPAWEPGTELAGSWGVRLLSTVRDAQPPRAILGLPDGREQVVKPGTLLPDQGIVVLAIGRDVVQVAEITPSGDHARVNTQVLQALYPSTAPAPR